MLGFMYIPCKSEYSGKDMYFGKSQGCSSALGPCKIMLVAPMVKSVSG